MTNADPKKFGAKPDTPRVTWSDGVVEVFDAHMFGIGGEEYADLFLGRLFQLEEVISVAIDRQRSTASIRHEAHKAALPEFITRLAASLRSSNPSINAASWLVGRLEGHALLFRRAALPKPPAYQVLVDTPGRLRLRVDAFRLNPVLAHRVERLIETVPGVRRVSAGPWSCRLVIHYDPSALPGEVMLRLAEEALCGPDVWSRTIPESPPMSLKAAGATLGIAAIGQYAIPALLPLSALLLVATNLRTFRTAWLQILRNRYGLPFLYTVIVVTTLMSGQFVASALMTWFFRFWHRRSQRELTTERHRLLDSCLPLPSTARLQVRGAEILIRAEQLSTGDRFFVSSGEAVPADALLLDGELVVDERSLKGLDGASRKRPGDLVLAGSVVLSGEARLEVDRPFGKTRAQVIARALMSTTSPIPGPSALTLKSEAFADQTVGATLATAGLGFLLGGVSTAGAILRPDYATGPGLGVPLDTLRAVASCVRRGIIVRDPTAFQRINQVSLVVLDDTPALRLCSLEVAGIEAGAHQKDLLRYAASAFLHLDDPRADAMRDACLAQSVHLLDLLPIDMKSGVTIRHAGRRIRIHESGPFQNKEGPLRVEIDGATAGHILFRRSKQPEAVRVIRRLRGLGVAQFALVSEHSPDETAQLASALGVNQRLSQLKPADKARFVARLEAQGMCTAFVGDCRRNATAAARAHVAIGVSTDAEIEDHRGADALHLLGDRLARLELVWELARSHVRKVRLDHTLVVAPNLLCVAGAFLFGFTGMTSVLISNLGTAGVYSRATGELRSDDLLDRRRLRLSQRTAV